MTSNIAPDLSGLYPFIALFLVVAVLGALLSLAIVGRSLGEAVVRSHRARLARHESIPTYYRHLVVTH